MGGIIGQREVIPGSIPALTHPSKQVDGPVHRDGHGTGTPRGKAGLVRPLIGLRVVGESVVALEDVDQSGHDAGRREVDRSRQVSFPGPLVGLRVIGVDPRELHVLISEAADCVNNPIDGTNCRRRPPCGDVSFGHPDVRLRIVGCDWKQRCPTYTVIAANHVNNPVHRGGA